MAEDPVQRRLAAILAADVVGYSRLMGEDEEGTLAALTAHIGELIEPCVAAHHGRVFKTTGDGLLGEFSSVVDAVRCAVALQAGMAERNAGTQEDRRIEFRIGVNLGDVIVQDDDVYGDGVNVAARLEQMAEPRGVYVSGNVFEQVEGKLDLRFDDLGEHQLKNISRATRVYAVTGRAAEPAAPAPSAAADPLPLPLPDKPSIAVLPFENMSGDAEQEYFADGISEDIITDLSKISGLFVIARNSSFVYKGKPVSIRQVGRDLGVRCVLEGSVRKAGNRVRITAQLIDATDDRHLWAERYDGALDDIFSLQDEVAQKVVAALEVSLTATERNAMTSTRKIDVEAYDLLLRARQYYSRFTPDANAEARRLLAEALERDPGYAEAMAALAESCAAIWHQGWSNDPVTTLEKGAELAHRAVELAPELADSHISLAHVWGCPCRC